MSDRDFSIISYEEFKKKTNAKIGGRKSLSLVDSKLKHYDRFGKNAGTASVVMLKELAAACQLYVEKKEQKALTKGASELLIRRVEAVRALIVQVYQRLVYLSYEDRKIGSLSNQGTLKTAPRVELGTVYKYEREDFLEKKQILGAKGLPNLQVNPTGAGFVKDQVEYGTKWNKIPETIKHIVNKAPSTWTFNDYKEIGRCFPVTIVNNPIVHFIRKDERLRHWMLYPDEGKLYTSHGAIADFSSYLYALDTYGNLIANDGESFGGKVKAVNKQDINEHGQANHSSLCAGRAVICAGMITIRKGYIVHIDNCSGHYAPKPHQLSRAIQILMEEYNLDLPRTLTRIRVLTGGNRESNFDSYRAFSSAFPLIK